MTLRYHGPAGHLDSRAAMRLLLRSHPEDEGALPIARMAALMAVDEREDADVEAILGEIARQAAKARVPAEGPLHLRVARLSVTLFGPGGLSGDTDTYDDPRNSDLGCVLDRGCGLPIALSVLMVAAADHVGLPLAGVAFPGHFIVGLTDPARARLESEGGRPFWIDPFHGGQVLGEDDLRGLLKRSFPEAPSPSAADWERFTRPASPRDVLVRMNLNLKRSWARRGNVAGTLRAIDRMLMLRPHDWRQHRDRGLLLARANRREAARDALATYLANVPDAPDAGRIGVVLSSLR